ncbi:hypothetical protein Lal_00033598 [Lupinus albus]|nr:hypothetical protein Lal_00033598 [Lupinus albus]
MSKILPLRIPSFLRFKMKIRDGQDTIGQKINITCEVQQLLGNNRKRVVAMSATNGLMRGMEVIHTGAPLSVLVGRATLGHIFNILKPYVVGYQPTLSTEMDDLNDPAPATTFAHLYATTVLSRGLAAKGIYLAVDPLNSTSTMLQPRIVGEEHFETAQRVKQTLQRYKEHQDIIAILGLVELSEEDRLTHKYLPVHRGNIYCECYKLRKGEQIEEMTLNLCVLTPNRIVWDSKVEEIILFTNNGQIMYLLPNL